MEIVAYLEQAVANQASDLFIVAGGPVCIKQEGHIRPIGEERLMPPKTKQLISEIYQLAERSMDAYEKQGDDDFSFAIASLARFRVSAYRQRGSMAAVVRVVSFQIPDWQKINIPQRIMDLAQTSHGMILMTGTAGSGKSTTQACLIDQINRTRNGHIITLEDPIEFLHRNQQCIISQREIAVDTADYPSALRSCLRQAPDVILLGEMRNHHHRSGNRPSDHRHPAHQGRHQRHRPNRGQLPQFLPVPDSHHAVHGAADGGVSADGSRQERQCGAGI